MAHQPAELGEGYTEQVVALSASALNGRFQQRTGELQQQAISMRAGSNLPGLRISKRDCRTHGVQDRIPGRPT
jgi:hypothetical protein